jgi:ATP-dependent Lhr-like helicase
MRETRVDGAGAEQIVAYIGETMASLGAVPAVDHLIAERFFDEAGGMQLVLHSPLGGRINRALGLALRKRFCLTFDFELQAAATDDGVVLSLGEQHSFALDGVFSMLRAGRVDADLTQAALVSPMFANRWRWNATRALALLRHTGGRRVPMPIQRMRAEDLLAAVFPAQVACGDNHAGPIEPVDHPLVNETLDNCLHEAMDAEGLKRVLDEIEAGLIRTTAVDTPAPSPMSHEILNANPYAFLDDAPLEERRARAVSLRRVDPDLASGIGALDPEAIAEVRRQAWPDARDADEVHDALLSLGLLPPGEAGAWAPLLEDLVRQGRAVRAGGLSTTAGGWLVATERVDLVRAAFPAALFVPAPPALQGVATSPFDGDPDAAMAEIVRGWMDAVGPTTAAALAARLGIEAGRIDASLTRLESQGCILRGRFSAGDPGEVEWCERGLLARIHRMTLGRLRREIEAVSAADFMRFLLRWQCVASGTQLHGRDGVRTVIAQLQGLELPGPAWERDVLRARLAAYDPGDLEQLCLAGEVAWGRLAVAAGESDVEVREGEEVRSRRRQAPTRSAPLAFFLREAMPELLAPCPEGGEWRERLSPASAEVYDHLERRGASFLADVARALRRLPTEVEDALWELVSCGLVTGDGIAGLRTLLLPEDERRVRPRHLRMLPRGGARRLMPVGRWSLLRAPGDVDTDEAKLIEAAAVRLLRRWGVVFRELLAREKRAPRWRSVLYVLRRMEARGEVRGGRFVAGFVGEQFALPEAVEALRAVRRREDSDGAVLVSAADPLNLAGIVTPGARVSPFSGHVIAWVGGLPVEAGELGAVLSRLQRRVAPGA